jgi:magnesium transporter
MFRCICVDQEGTLTRSRVERTSDLPAKPTSADEFIWIDIRTVDGNLLRDFAELYEFDELSVEDALTPHHYPKLEDFGNYRFMLLRALRPPKSLMSEEEQETDEEQHTQTLSFYYTENLLVTHRALPLTWLDELFDSVGRLRWRVPIKGAAIVHQIIDTMVDRFMRDLVVFEDRLESMENLVVEDLSRFELSDTLMFKRELTTLRHIIRDQRVVVMRFANETPGLRDGNLHRLFRDVDDHLRVVLGTVDKQIDSIDGLRDVYFAMANIQLGDILKVLAVITTVGAPLQIIVGMYGMNFGHMPLLHEPYGFWIVTGLMILLVALMLMVFKRLRWI